MLLVLTVFLHKEKHLTTGFSNDLLEIDLTCISATANIIIDCCTAGSLNPETQHTCSAGWFLVRITATTAPSVQQQQNHQQLNKSSNQSINKPINYSTDQQSSRTDRAETAHACAKTQQQITKFGNTWCFLPWGTLMFRSLGHFTQFLLC